MQRVLDLEHDPESTPSYSKRDLLRTMAKRGLIMDAEIWFKFLDARNQTVHGYDNKQAETIFKEVKKFPSYVADFISNVENKYTIE